MDAAVLADSYIIGLIVFGSDDPRAEQLTGLESTEPTSSSILIGSFSTVEGHFGSEKVLIVWVRSCLPTRQGFFFATSAMDSGGLGFIGELYLRMNQISIWTVSSSQQEPSSGNYEADVT